MIEYARMDTHYLIDIYNIMKDALIDKGNEQNNLLNATYSQSNALCKSFKNSYIIQWIEKKLNVSDSFDLMSMESHCI